MSPFTRSARKCFAINVLYVQKSAENRVEGQWRWRTNYECLAVCLWFVPHADHVTRATRITSVSRPADCLFCVQHWITSILITFSDVVNDVNDVTIIVIISTQTFGLGLSDDHLLEDIFFAFFFNNNSEKKIMSRPLRKLNFLLENSICFKK